VRQVRLASADALARRRAIVERIAEGSSRH
jgi:hypothetical protein